MVFYLRRRLCALIREEHTSSTTSLNISRPIGNTVPPIPPLSGLAKKTAVLEDGGKGSHII